MLAAARRCNSSRLRCGGPSSLRGGARRHAGAGPALSGPAAARVDPAAAAPAPAEGSFLARLLIPWPELAAMSEDAELNRRIEVYSSTYCLISTLMCSVSATALLTAVPDHRGSNAGGSTAGATAEAMAEAILNHELKEQPTPPAAPPIHSGILSRETAVELYVGGAAGSLVSGLCGLGVSTICLALNAVNPPGAAATFAIQHGALLTAIPIFTTTAVAMNAFALSAAVDASVGRPVSWITFVGTAAAGTLVLGATARGMLKNYQLRRVMLRK